MCMRKLPLLAVVFVSMLPASLRADAPSLISYQGVLMQDSGIVVQDGLYDLQFRIFPQAVGGTTPLFQQTLAVEVRKGLYNVILSDQGGYDLLQMFRDNAQLFMEVTVLANPPLGLPSSVVLQPRQQLVSVPYALATRGGHTDAVVSTPLTTPATMSGANTWRTVPGFNTILISAPAPECHLRVRASVSLARASGEPLVGVRLERSTDGTTFSTVRGPSPVYMANADDLFNVSLEHVVRDAPPNVAYTYRIAVKEDTGGQDFTVSPNVSGIGQTESLLEGEVWCP